MQKIRKALTMELALCETKRDIARVFDAVENDIRARLISRSDQLIVLKEVEKKLPMLLAHDKRGTLIEDARSRIHRILNRLSQ